MQIFEMIIDGKEVSSKSGSRIDSINPYTLKPWASIPRADAQDADLAVQAAARAFEGPWSTLTPSQRGELLRKIGDVIAENAERLAEIDVTDNGKIISEMAAQARYLPKYFYYYAGLCDKVEGKVAPLDRPNMVNLIQYEPLGVCIGITAWNSPLILAAWKLAPALAAGNTYVLKPSEHASVSTIEFVKLFEKAGFPPGVVNVVTGYGPEVGEALVKHPKVAKISFTGSEEGGRAVYQNAAADFKHVTLELGGKSPNIVFADAEFDAAVKGVISGIFAASGQTCIAGSRFLVQEEIHDRFVEALVDFAKQAKMGDPLSWETQVGPITMEAQYQKVLKYLQIAKDEGAKCVLGGKPAEGWFIEPTIFTQVKNSMRIAQEEVFGPVLAVIPFKDEEEALTIANDTKYGLAAGLWTKDMSRILRLPSKIKSGVVWVNTYRAFSCMSPFGGCKHSGIGRECGQDAIYEFLQEKSIWMNTNFDVPNPFQMKI
jgi:(Z)-2-((N-methylformamido)methylene)-5-hydroxybutyrolactone dehydrogenase